MRRFLAFVVIVSLYLFGAVTQVLAAAAFDEKAVADFYRGKTVRIIVGFSGGGGYDAYSRLIGRHLQKHIPGNPSVIVDNMAGAGSIIAANQRLQRHRRYPFGHRERRTGRILEQLGVNKDHVIG